MDYSGKNAQVPDLESYLQHFYFSLVYFFGTMVFLKIALQ